MIDLEAKARAATAGNPSANQRCCSRIGGAAKHLDVVVQSTRVSAQNEGGTYQAGVIFLPTENSDSREVLVHEWAHAFIAFYNDRLIVSNQRFAIAFQEGMADTIAGLYGLLSGDPTSFGDAFVMGDGTGTFAQNVRSGRENRLWSDIRNAPNAHEGGRAFYNFFFRLKQELPTLSNERLLAIALGTAASLTPDANMRYGVSDFRTAVISVLRDEPAILAAVNRVYDAMYDPAAAGPLPAPGSPGEPGPPGAPFAPASLFGSFAFCGEQGGIRGSIYSLSWSSSAGATQYGGYVKTTSEDFYRLTAVIPAPQTSAPLVTNTDGDARITACSAFGCSGLSLDRFAFSQQPQCEGF